MPRIKFSAILAQFTVLSMLLLFGSRALATSLPINGSVSGTLTGPAQTYSVVVPSDGDLTVTLATSAGLYGRLDFLDSDGTTSIVGYYTAYGSSNTTVVTHLAPGATYSVKVAIYAGSGAYTLSDTLALPAIANDTETNDTTLTALPLTLGTPVAGHLGYSRTSYTTVDGVDYYKFTVPADGDVTFTVTTNGSLYSRFDFIDSNGTTSVGGYYTAYGSSNAMTITHLAPGATYYARIALYAGYGTYQLGTALVPPTVANDVENNDTYKKSLKLADKITASGHIGYSRTAYADVDSSDFYKFSASANGDINFSLTTNASLYARVNIYDSNGTTYINGFYTAYGSTNSMTLPHFGTGATYYVNVVLYAGYGSYQLTRTLIKQTVKNDSEKNDTYLKANVFAPNTTKTGNLGYSRNNYGTVDGIDYYKITVTKAGTLNVNLTTTSSLYARVNFYGTDGVTYINGFYVAYGSAGNMSISLPAAGTYYVAVSVYAQWGGYTMTNTFQ